MEKIRSCCIMAHSSRTPDSAWSWFVCFSACLSGALIFGMLKCFAVVMPVFMDNFMENRERTAWAGSLAIGLGFLCMPLSTMVMTRLNIRYTAILGILMCTTSLVATSCTTNIIQVFFSYGILYGLGFSLVYNSCIFATTKYFDKRQSVAIGFVAGSSNIGVLTLGPIVQLLIDLYGFRTMYRIIAGSFVLPLLAVCSFDPNVKDPATAQKQRRDDESQPDEWNWSMALEIFKRPMYVVAVIVIILQVMGAFGWFVHLVNYCREVGIPAQKASNLFVAIGITSLIASIVAGRIMDNKSVNPFHVNQAGALSMALATILFQVSSSYILFVCFSALLGLGIGIFHIMAVLLLLKTVESRLTLYSFPIGLLFSAIADFSGPPLIGFIADTIGSYKPAFYAAGAILLLSFFLPFLQYYFKPLEIEGQPTEIDITVSPENKDLLPDNSQNAVDKETVALETMDWRRTQDDMNNICSVTNLQQENEENTPVHSVSSQDDDNSEGNSTKTKETRPKNEVCWSNNQEHYETVI